MFPTFFHSGRQTYVFIFHHHNKNQHVTDTIDLQPTQETVWKNINIFRDLIRIQQLQESLLHTRRRSPVVTKLWSAWLLGYDQEKWTRKKLSVGTPVLLTLSGDGVLGTEGHHGLAFWDEQQVVLEVIVNVLAHLLHRKSVPGKEQTRVHVLTWSWQICVS